MAMTNEEKYAKWLENAREDLVTAEVMLHNGRYSYVAFMCEQALEKLAKGIFVFLFEKEAPFTHNINAIIKDFDAIVNDKKYEEYEFLFSKLTSYYIIGRYDVYKQQMAQSLDQKACDILLTQTKEAFVWLQSQVKP